VRGVLNLMVLIRGTEALAAIHVALTMEAASTSETSVYFNQTTRRNIPEDSHLDLLPRSKGQSSGSTLN
jgi:hypothetical protein